DDEIDDGRGEDVLRSIWVMLFVELERRLKNTIFFQEINDDEIDDGRGEDVSPKHLGDALCGAGGEAEEINDDEIDDGRGEDVSPKHLGDALCGAGGEAEENGDEETVGGRDEVEMERILNQTVPHKGGAEKNTELEFPSTMVMMKLVCLKKAEVKGLLLRAVDFLKVKQMFTESLQDLFDMETSSQMVMFAKDGDSLQQLISVEGNHRCTLVKFSTLDTIPPAFEVEVKVVFLGHLFSQVWDLAPRLPRSPVDAVAQPPRELPTKVANYLLRYHTCTIRRNMATFTEFESTSAFIRMLSSSISTEEANKLRKSSRKRNKFYDSLAADRKVPPRSSNESEMNPFFVFLMRIKTQKTYLDGLQNDEKFKVPKARRMAHRLAQASQQNDDSVAFQLGRYLHGEIPLALLEQVNLNTYQNANPMTSESQPDDGGEAPKPKKAKVKVPLAELPSVRTVNDVALVPESAKCLFINCIHPVLAKLLLSKNCLILIVHERKPLDVTQFPFPVQRRSGVMSGTLVGASGLQDYCVYGQKVVEDNAVFNGTAQTKFPEKLWKPATARPSREPSPTSGTHHPGEAGRQIILHYHFLHYQ
uniref:Uncharacterized protein n=1 Tax=Caenorhabditis japonica TaxID=281687 RepID=A0A8R1I9D9_CAEJA